MTALLAGQAETIATTLSRLMRALGTPEDPACDLPLAQLRLCHVLRESPRTMTSLSKELGTSQSAITQTADRLERAGIIERLSEDDDRRLRHLRLTAHGAAMLEARRTARTRRIAEALAALPNDQRAGICEALGALLQASIATRADGPAAG